jgi:peroxiredoxin
MFGPSCRKDPLYRQIGRCALAILWIQAVIAGYAQPAAPIEVGSRVEDFKLQDAYGTTQSLQSYSGRVVILFFWSFKCPVSLAYSDRLEDLQKKYRNRGVVVLAVAPANETPEEIRANTANLKITTPVLLDSEGELAGKLGASHTPSVFLLDEKSILRYKGAPDNNKLPGDRGRIAYIDDATEALLNGNPIRVAETKPFGCNIKRRGFRE